MADPKKMSIEEILAAARKQDGGGQDDSPADDKPAEETPAAEATESEAKPAKSASEPAKKVDSKTARKMSVEEMLAAARGEKSGEAAADDDSPAEEEPAEEAAPAVSSKDARKMSVAEMMAAARGEKSKPAAAKKKPAAKKSPAKAAAKASPKEPAAEAKKDDGPLDTASILAAARKSSKRGPISKSEAEAKGVPAPKRAKAPKLQAPPMPEKPAYAKKRAASTDSDRRGFLAAMTAFTVGSPLAIGFTTVALTNLMWVLGLARYMFPNILTEPPTSFKVGFPGDLAPGQVEAKYKAQFGVWIVRGDYQGESQIYALKSVCTHLGCTPNWLEGEQKFKCPCHGSGFYKDGINFEGPAPRPLERYAIKLADDGQLEVDKSATFLEEKGDWKDPACKVPV